MKMKTNSTQNASGNPRSSLGVRAGNEEWPYRTRLGHHFALRYAYPQTPRTSRSARNPSAASSSSVPHNQNQNTKSQTPQNQQNIAKKWRNFGWKFRKWGLRSCLFDGLRASEADTALFSLALLAENVEFPSRPNCLEGVVGFGNLDFHGDGLWTWLLRLLLLGLGGGAALFWCLRHGFSTPINSPRRW